MLRVKAKQAVITEMAAYDSLNECLRDFVLLSLLDARRQELTGLSLGEPDKVLVPLSHRVLFPFLLTNVLRRMFMRQIARVFVQHQTIRRIEPLGARN